MTCIPAIRKQLRSAAAREPQSVQPFTNLLDTQLRNYARSNEADRAALKPEIERSIKRLEAARDGR